MMDKSGRARGAISYEDENDNVYVAMGEDVEESQPNLIWALSNLTPNKVCIIHVHVPPLSIPFRSAMFLKTVGRENRIREYQEMERRKVERVFNGYLRSCIQEGVPAEVLFFTRDSIEKGIVEFICTHGIKKLVMGEKKAGYVCKYAPNFCYIWVISKGFFSYSRQIHQESPNTNQFERNPQQEAGVALSSRSRGELSYDDDHVYVAMGEDVEESEPNLIWALCNLQPKQIYILHVHVPPLDVPFRSAMFLKSAGRKDRIREYQEIEKRKVENIVNEYLRICDQAEVPAKILYATRDSVENGIIELICTHDIKKLVMGAKKAVYVSKYAPEFCHIWVISKGFLTYIRQNEFIEKVKATHQESPNSYQYERKYPEEETKEVAPKIMSDVSSEEFFVTSPPLKKDKPPALSLASVGKGDYVNEVHNGLSTFSITEKVTDQDFFDKLEQISKEIGHFKRESYEDAIKRKKFEMETITAQQREREFRTMFEKELDQRIEFEFDLERSKERGEKVALYINKVNENLQAEKQDNSSLENRIERSNKMVKQIENKMVVATDLSNKYKEEKEQFHVEKINADKFAFQLREMEVDSENPLHQLMPRFFLDISISEIQEATSYFDPKLKLFEDDCTCTYRGFLRNIQVSVKVYKPFMWEGLSKFHEEVSLLSMVRHPNLIMLMGVCNEKLIVVYEHFPNGSLEDRLKCQENTPPLSWQTRTKIAAELCSVLMFLHSSTPNPIVYGELKPSNVFLDANFKVKLGDLGIARPKDVAAYGFVAYMDPEFLATGELTPQCNVYSFGVILLRLLTGRLAPGLTTEIQIALAEGKLKNLLDHTAGDWPLGQAKQLLQLAMSCVELKPWRRPDLALEVWNVLESITTSQQTSKFPRSIGEECPTSFLCPINQEVMEEPVIAADGFSYEEEAIKAWFGGGHETSPMTNLRLPNCNLLPNHALRSAIKAWLQHQS